MFVAVAALNEHGKDNLPPVTFIYPEFWLDSIQLDYYNLHWGQTIYGLPLAVREVFLKHFPNYSESKFISWGEFRKIRETIKEQLKAGFVKDFNEGEPISILNINNAYM